MPTATDALTQKFEKAFHALDTSGNGYIEWDDFEGAIKRIVSEYGLAASDKKATALRNAYQMLWSELTRHADTDRDNRISKDEYIQASQQAVGDSSRFKAVETIGNALVDVIDTDGDGKVSRDEFARLQQNVWGVKDASAIDTFDQLDVDGDGHLTRKEMLTGGRQFFTSNDPNAPGGMFLGRL